MLFLVKTEAVPDKVEELTRKVINHEIKAVKGNLVFLTPDGKFGYDIIEANNESEVREMYKHYDGYLKIHEIVPVMSAGHFYATFQQKHGGPMGGLRQ